MGDATGLGCSEVDGTETGAGTMDDDGPGGAEGKVDIVAREKRTDADSEIYYAPEQERNPDDARQDQQDTYTD